MATGSRDAAVPVSIQMPDPAAMSRSSWSSAQGQSPRLALEVEALAVRAEVLVANQTPQVRDWATDRGRLRRFLQGHGGNADRALATLRWCLEQRRQLQLWHIDLEEVRPELELGKVLCRSIDRDLHPVVVYRNCRADHTLDLTMRLRALVLVLDHLEACLDRGDFDGCTTWVVILDLGGKPAKGSMTFDYLSRLIKLFMKSYPARLHRCFVVDATMLMNTFWRAACKILEADTIRKVSFVRRSWDDHGRCCVPELIDQVGVEQLEDEYGGRDHFEWDPSRHWRVLDLVPNPRRELPLIEAARLAALEAGTAGGAATGSACTGCGGRGCVECGRSSDDASCAGDSLGSGGHSATGESEGRWFDADSEEGVGATPLDSVLRDCRSLHKQLGPGLPAGDLDPRLMRLRAELARFLQDWEDGADRAMEEDWHHSNGHSYQCGDHEKDPLKPHHIAIQDSPSSITTAAASAASVARPNADVRLKALLTISGTTLFLVVILFGLIVVRLSEGMR